MASILYIDGVLVDRHNLRIVPQRLMLSLDRPDEFEFVELSASMPGLYHPEQSVVLFDDSAGTILFSGAIYSRTADGFGSESGRVGYRCIGPTYAASLVAITASDGTGTMQFNLPVTDPYYSATEAGLSVGTIVSQVLDQHLGQLAEIGIYRDGTTAAQLAALTVVSPDPVYISGNSLWTQLQQLLQLWYGSRYALRVEPSGVVRCWDTTALAAHTVTLDSEPAVLVAINEDTSECYTQVVLRGRDDVEPVMLSLHDGTLAEGWTAGQQAAWTYRDFSRPTGGYDQGAIVAFTSTVVTVQSDYPAAHWPTNYWPGIQGQINCINGAATGIAMTEYRHITADDALAGGGTSQITVDRPFASSGYTRYTITGIPGGLAYVWRKYTIPNTYIAEHLVLQFNYSVPFTTSMSAVAMTSGPAGVLALDAGGGGLGLQVQVPFNFEVVPFDGVNPGYILAFDPVVKSSGVNTQAQLDAGGSHVVGPTDVMVLVPYSRGTLSVASPAGGGYSGTAYTGFGVERTLYRDYPTWIDGGNSANMQTLADNILATTSNAVQEGQLVYFDRYTPALPGGSWPMALGIARVGGTTGYEAMAAPVRTVTLEWPQQGGSIWTTHLSFTTRRQMYSGDRLYVHPMYLEGGAFAGVGQELRAGVGFGGVSGLPSPQQGGDVNPYREAAAAGLGANPSLRDAQQAMGGSVADARRQSATDTTDAQRAMGGSVADMRRQQADDTTAARAALGADGGE